MKTVFIFDQLDASIKFFIKDGDYSYLNDVYINSCMDDKLEDELNHLVYNQNNGEYLVLLQDSFPTDIGEQFKVVVTGFLP